MLLSETLRAAPVKTLLSSLVIAPTPRLEPIIW